MDNVELNDYIYYMYLCTLFIIMPYKPERYFHNLEYNDLGFPDQTLLLLLSAALHY